MRDLIFFITSLSLAYFFGVFMGYLVGTNGFKNRSKARKIRQNTKIPLLK